MIGVHQHREGAPSIAVLPGTIIATILSLVQSTVDRNSISEVCRGFRLFERQSRRSLAVRALRRHLGLVPPCFSSVIDLDLSALTLLPSEDCSFQFDKSYQVRLSRAFPNVRTLKLTSVSDDSVREICRIWPRIENLSFTYDKDQGHPAQLRTVLETFKHCKVLDARNLQCRSLATALSGLECLALTSLNIETMVITSDLDMEIIAKTCSSLESLCVTIQPGRVIGEGLLSLANHCKKLSNLRLFLYLDSLGQFNVENARKCLRCIARITSEIPGIGIHISFQHIPSIVTGYRMECLMRMAVNIRSLVLYSTDAALTGLWSCKNLTELTFGTCEGLGDHEIVAVIKNCPKLVTLRILDCNRVTQQGLKEMAKIAKLTSLSLCFLKVPVKAQVNSVKSMSSSLSAFRLMVNGPVDSLSGLSGWRNLSRLELTLTSKVPHTVLMEPWLESCPNLKHLGLVIQNWCPTTLRFLLMVPSLHSLSLSFWKRISEDVLLSFLMDLALLPELAMLSLFICNREWLSEDAGSLFAEFPKLKSLNIFWIGDPFQDRQFSVRPLLVKLLSMKCLQNIQLPSLLADENDLKIFYQGLHAHTVQSLLRSIYDLKTRDGPSRTKITVMYERELAI